MILHDQSYIEVKEEITIEEHHLPEFENLGRLEADNNHTSNGERLNTLKGTKICAEGLRNSDYESYVQVKEEITIVEHYLSEFENLVEAGMEADQTLDFKQKTKDILARHRKEHMGRLHYQSYIQVKEEMTIEEHHLPEFENLGGLVANNHQTLDLKQKTTDNLARLRKEHMGRLSTEVYIHVKEEITIEECHLSQYEDLRRLEADDHQTLDLKHKGTLSTSVLSCKICSTPCRDLMQLNEHSATHLQKHLACKVCHKTFKTKDSLARHRKEQRFQMDSFTEVKEEITIDEHDLTTYDTLELDADNDSTCNVETQNTVMQSNPCSKPNRDSLHLKEHLFTHPGERSHACETFPFRCQVETLPLSIEVSIQKKLCTSARVVIKGSYTQQVDIPTRLQNEWYIPIKEEITIDEHDLLEVQNLEIKADERRTLNTKDQKTSKNVLCCKICSQPCGDFRLQNEWYIPIKEEITIDEHDLLEVQNLEIKADERRTLNTKDQKTSKNVLCCKICSQPCGGLLELNEHLLTHPQERTHGCDVCGLKFKWRKNLVQHRNTHFKKCNICQKQFKWDSDVLIHARTHSDDRPFVCDFCSSPHQSKHELEVRRNRQAKEKHYNCEICHKSFLTMTSFLRHEVVHSEYRPFECDFCEQTFKSKQFLQAHRNTHTKEKYYECEVCHERFLSSQVLCNHKIVHSDHRPFECDICKKTFKEKRSLQVHRNTHTKEKRYECEVCHKSFLTISGLCHHEVVHSDQRPFECDICKQTFKVKFILQRHRNLHTKLKHYECEVCHKIFFSIDDLRTHKPVHSDAPF
ncbi:zinc finger protein 728 [Dendroctonus ponderosae]|uniref:zinc finger protein 728 n=1 Tax=Dendroctonus ponderosae TaxID=77166 RepID=UPI0020358FE3|nr:zinc finger protein 728 [Dendroctonus ponderosae]